MTSYLPPKTSSLACADTEHTRPLEQDMNVSTDTTDTVPNQMESTESYEDFIPTPGRIPKSIMSALGYELVTQQLWSPQKGGKVKRLHAYAPLSV